MTTTIDRNAALGRLRRLTRYGKPEASQIAAIRTCAFPTLTYEEAILRLVAHDIARWGEAERAASERLNRQNYPTLGLALNRLAHIDLDAIDETLAAQAILVMTDADVATLRRGG